MVYLTAERFMYHFVRVLREQGAGSPLDRMAAIDVLILDDMQFLQGKAIQREFRDVLDTMIGAGRQVILAADEPPVHLSLLDERVRSRLAGGLCVPIGAPDLAMRIAILAGKIKAAQTRMPGFDVPYDIVRHVAGVVTTNGRDLEGAANRLMAAAIMTQAPIDQAMADVAIRDLVRPREPKKVRIEDIQRLIAEHYNMSRVDIMSSRRTANVVRPRQIAMYLSKALTLRSLPEIGRRFGGRDHTTVLHAVRKIDGLMAADVAMRDEIGQLKAMLEDRA